MKLTLYFGIYSFLSDQERLFIGSFRAEGRQEVGFSERGRASEQATPGRPHLVAFGTAKINYIY